MNTVEAGSLRALEDTVAALAPTHHLCYRGHRESRWKLIPTAFRALTMTRHIDVTDYDDLARIERDTYREFDSEARSLLHKMMPLVEQIAVAQHYGVPTRCLDWTTDIRVAAFFAANSPDDSDAAIWALDLTSFPFPKELGRQHRSGGFLLPKLIHYCRGHQPSFAQEVSVPIGTFGAPQPPQPAAPPSTFVVVHPPRECHRLRQQSGLLSWHHTFSDADLVWDYTAYLKKVERTNHLQFLTKIRIPKRNRAEIRRDLRRFRVTPFSLFPDLDGLGRQLTEAHEDEILRTFK